MIAVSRRCGIAGLLLVALALQARAAELESTLGATNIDSPSLAAAAEGSVAALAWFETGGPALRVRLSVSRDAGTTFPEATLAGTALRSGAITKPLLAIVRTQNGGADVIVAYPAEQQGRRGVEWLRSSDGTAPQRQFFAQPASTETADLVALASDAQGSVHSLWLAGARLFYARGDAAGFGAPVQLDDAATPCAIARLARRGSDVMVIWHRRFANDSQDFAFARSSDGGATFSAPAATSNDAWGFKSCPNNSPTLSIDANGAVRFVFGMPNGDSAPTMLVDRSADGRTFKPRSFLEAVDGFSQPRYLQMAADRDGGLAAILDGVRNDRRYVVVRHSLGAPDGSGALDADWMRPAAPIVLDSSGSGEAPVLAPTAAGMLTAWISRQAGTDAVRVRQLTIDQLCGRAPVPASGR
jgi:hypothetical protein